MFHITTAFTMGLKKLIWAFLALYPAVIYCTMRSFPVAQERYTHCIPATRSSMRKRRSAGRRGRTIPGKGRTGWPSSPATSPSRPTAPPSRTLPTCRIASSPFSYAATCDIWGRCEFSRQVWPAVRIFFLRSPRSNAEWRAPISMHRPGKEDLSTLAMSVISTSSKADPNGVG
jgi:hypothetical protein